MREQTERFSNIRKKGKERKERMFSLLLTSNGLRDIFVMTMLWFGGLAQSESFGKIATQSGVEFCNYVTIGSQYVACAADCFTDELVANNAEFTLRNFGGSGGSGGSSVAVSSTSAVYQHTRYLESSANGPDLSLIYVSGSVSVEVNVVFTGLFHQNSCAFFLNLWYKLYSASHQTEISHTQSIIYIHASFY